ncbi:MAG: pitrilysin family protein [Ruminiclostridium sp.]|nr:pitrilysin family protein [Ruminiclostridium sp.]
MQKHRVPLYCFFAKECIKGEKYGYDFSRVPLKVGILKGALILMKTVEYSRISEKLYQYNHISGLKVFVIPKKGYKKIYATFATFYGSVNNTFTIPGSSKEIHVPDGIAHFLEHKLFEQKDGDISDKFAELGSESNAYTSFTQTVYLFTCTSSFEENFKLLVDFVQHPYLTDENVEKEKGIIGQEIKMYEDNADWRVFFNLLEALFVQHPVKIDIAGTVESISKITKDTLYTCYNTFYHPSNMVILVVGDVEPETVIKIVEEGIEDRENPGEIGRRFQDEPAHHNKKMVEKKLAVSMPQFQMGIKDNSRVTGYELIKRKISLEIILSVLIGRSSLLYNQLYSEGLINQNFDYEVNLEGHFGFSSWGGQSKDPHKVADRINEAISNLHSSGLDESIFNRIRKAHEGRFIRSLNSPENISYEFIPLYFKGANYFDYSRLYEELTLQEAQTIFKEHFSQEPSLSIIWPLNDSK